jgi:acetylornithine deacetylase/succinyl-diaminopimelate desuccinylase-like protein
MSRLRALAALAVLALSSTGAAAQSSIGGTVAADRHHPPASQVLHEVRSYRQSNQDRIMRELREFLAIPNVASDTANIQKNAERLKELLEARGIETHLLSIENRGPVVFGKLDTLGAARTLIFYAHYDGQPVVASEWTDKAPFEPVLRDKPSKRAGSKIPFPDAARNPNSYQDEWRIYARSASDDKSPIVAMLAALDALRDKNIPLAVNLRFLLEGEEERDRSILERTLRLHKNLLKGDLLITGDGPVHQSGRPLVFFGNRGDIGLDITVYGPVRSLHSGHYGNWAPNPALELAQLLAAMKDENGGSSFPATTTTSGRSLRWKSRPSTPCLSTTLTCSASSALPNPMATAKNWSSSCRSRPSTFAAFAAAM